MIKDIALMVIITAVLLCTGCNRFDTNPDSVPTIRDHTNNTTMQGSNEVNIKEYGAVGDDDTADTAAIQRAVDNVYSAGGGVVHVPDGIYIVDAVKSIRLKSNTQLHLSSGATLQAAPNDSENYAVVRIINAENVEVVGGKITGERDYHVGDSGEWGHGIQVLGSNKVKISEIAVSDCWGDGIYIGSSQEQNYCHNVIIEKFQITNCRRNGITVISGRFLTIREGIISDTNGTDPQSAICLEPNNAAEYMEDILIDNVQAANSNKYGLLFGFSRYTNTLNDVSISLRNFSSIEHGHKIYNNYDSFRFARASVQINIL